MKIYVKKFKFINCLSVKFSYLISEEGKNISLGQKMESKKLFDELFEEEKDEEYVVGASDAQCHYWYVYGVMGGCFGTGSYTCSLWYQYCSNPRRT